MTATLTDAETYLGGRTRLHRSELALFPLMNDPLEELEDLEPELLVDRFRWLTRYFKGWDPEQLLDLWLCNDPLAVERAAEPGGTWEEFKRNSKVLGLTLLREEARWYSYYKQLRDSLFSRTDLGERVLFIGPTAGGDLEAISAGRGFPVYLNSMTPAEIQAESRAMSDGVAFDSVTLEQILKEPQRTRYAVLSPYEDDPITKVNMSYDLLGLYGYILFPTCMVDAVETAEELGMARRDLWQDELSLYFKHPGLPELTGD